jgi:hypothetical protein
MNPYIKAPNFQLSTPNLQKRKVVKKMEQMLGLVANLGFPIVVSVYLLVRIENRMENLTESIHQLAEAVAALKQ